ncbi:MAG: IS200/IS605 family transposase [Gemmatimonadota bacterium]|nr:IS200/IS605 family transposase [Gemmatimonadota bacterium]
MRHRLFVHLVWTTMDRRPLINLAVAQYLSRYLPAIAAEERAQVIALGIVSTHLHLLLRLHPATQIARMVMRMKGGSSRLASTEGHAPSDAPLRWARGYNLESVSARALPAVSRYVADQAARHPDEAIAGWVAAEVRHSIAWQSDQPPASTPRSTRWSL